MLKTINNIHQQFASYFGEPKLSPFLFHLSQKMSEGHICIDVDELGNETYSNTEEHFKINKENLENNKLVSNDGAEYRPFVLHQNRLYLQRYFAYETQLLQKLNLIIEQERTSFESRKLALESQKTFVKNLFSNNITKEVDWQLVAAITAVINNFTIITGGPGTGKTTTVAKIVSILYQINPSQKVALAAPTGKAAARMADSLAQTDIGVCEEIAKKLKTLKPATIHRLLGTKRNSPYFVHNAANPLDFDVLIIDESSMIDFALFAKLLDAVSVNTRIIFLGDKNQLASVEAGSLFGDLCNTLQKDNEFSESRSNFINEFIDTAEHKLANNNITESVGSIMFQHIVSLQYSFRFAGDKAIGKLSKAIIKNDVEIIQQFLQAKNNNEVQIDDQHDDAFFVDFIKKYAPIFDNQETMSLSENIIEALNHLNSIRVLCAVKQGEQGVYQLNKKIELYFQKEKDIAINEVFYEHRPIMVTSNVYPLGLYNGDIGILKRDENGIIKAWFLDSDVDGKPRLRGFLPPLIPNMETVFAMTIHKSQGSEFENVLVVLPKENTNNLLTRELLYTAVTRAKKQVKVQATASTFLAVSAAKVARGSGITQRINDTQ